jgi:imidazolonepropionase-like amidohydrolase
MIAIARNSILRPCVGTLLSVVAFTAVIGATGCGDVGQPVELAIVNANVVPMDTERVLENQTILIDSGRIVAIGPAGELSASGAAEVVDAQGGYVVPGLADMHVHVWSQQDLVPHVANGITLVRNMWGQPLLLDLRARVAAGDILGPTIVTAGPIVDGEPPIWDGSDVAATPEDARRIVAEQKAAGYDFIKVYNRVPDDALEAIVEEARSQGMPVAGHVPDAIPLERALELGFGTIEHLTGFARATRTEGGVSADGRASLTASRSLASGDIEWAQVFDPARLDEVTRAAAQSATYQVPTLIVNRRIWTSRRQAGELMQRPGVRYMSPAAVASWNPDTDFRLRGLPDEDLETVQILFDESLRRVAALHEAGVPILAGTDAPNPHVLHGWSLHEELALLHEAGLSNFEALVAATRAPAEFLGTPGEFGTVQVGRRADLVIARGNPLDDLSALGSPVGVVLRGEWHSRAELDAALQDVAAAYATPSDWFAGLELNTTSVNGGEIAEYRIRFNDAEIGAVRTATGMTGDTASAVAAQSVFSVGDRVVNDCTMRYGADGTFASADCTLTDSRGEHRFEIAVVDGNVVLTGTDPAGDDISSSIPADGSPLVMLGTIAPGLRAIATRFGSLAVGETASATVIALDTQSGTLRLVPEAWTIERAPDNDGHIVLHGNATGTLGNYDVEIESTGGTLERAVLRYQMGVMVMSR